MQRGWRGLVAGEMDAGQCADDAVYRAIDPATGNLDTTVRRCGTSDRFPRDCRAPKDRSIHEPASGAVDR